MSSLAWLMPAGSRDRAVGNYYQEQTIIAIVDDDESVCHAIKGLVRSPIIFLTAHDEVSVRERALAAGAVAFLRKPFAAELLIKTLRAAVKLDANA